MVVRYQGGDNAGHTVVSGDEVFKLRLTPSGVLYPHITSVIGNGVVVNPVTLIGELDMLASRGIDVVARPRQPQRARDHAVPRRARRGNEARLGGAKVGHDRARHRPDLRRSCVAARPAHGGPARPGGPARAARARAARQEPRPGGDGPARPSRSSRCSSEALGWGERLRDHLADTTWLVQAALAARRARPARGRPGHAARPRPRQLSVRDLVEPGRRRRLHRRRHRAAPGRRGHRGHEGVLDARRRGAVPDRAARRDRRRHRRARPRVRDRHRSAAAGRLVRRRAAALRRGGQQREQHHAQQARHPVGHRDDPAVRRLRDRRPAGRGLAVERRRAGARDAGLRGVPGLGASRSTTSARWPTCPRTPGATCPPSRSTPACRSCSSPSGPSGPRRSSAPGGRCATGRGCRRDASSTPTRILVVGGGGREHALAWKLAGEPGVNEVVVAPGQRRASRPSRGSAACPASTRSTPARSSRWPVARRSSWSSSGRRRRWRPASPTR